MYKVKGIDGKEYGPVSAAQVRAWVFEGRLNAATPLCSEPGEDWKPASEFPELADLFQGTAGGTPMPPPISQTTDHEAEAREIIGRGFNVDIGACLGRAWDLMQKDFWPILGITALVWLLIIVASSAYVGLVVNGPFLGGLYYYYFRKLRGQPARIEDAFAGFSIAFVQLMLAYLVSTVLIGVGLALCIIPGIYLFVAWSFALLLVVDRKMEFWAAMELSRKVVTSQFWSVFGLVMIVLLLNLAGFLACLIGLLITIPWTTLAIVYAYEDIFSARSAPVA
jgi:hypothetical protein